MLFLIFLLISKEVASTDVEAGKTKPTVRMLSAYLNVPVLPLLLVFAAIVVFKALEVL